jgi:hypothetical protein
MHESACNERTGDCKYGWSPVGRSVELEYSLKRSGRWSLLPAMTLDGYLAHRIFQGAITARGVLAERCAAAAKRLLQC